jgi:hypothetical protein
MSEPEPDLTESLMAASKEERQVLDDAVGESNDQAERLARAISKDQPNQD